MRVGGGVVWTGVRVRDDVLPPSFGLWTRCVSGGLTRVLVSLYGVSMGVSWTCACIVCNHTYCT